MHFSALTPISGIGDFHCRTPEEVSNNINLTPCNVS